ncbi:GNAT family N-acetyltransferase [Pandoraea sputorum]|uniref:GNAT family N-acetyltransferase n=1 Tax=Pandoraea sputorum TaxID=93222 RepID=UPI001428C8A7
MSWGALRKVHWPQASQAEQQQETEDLLFRKSLLHVRLLLRKRTLLDFGWPCLQGACHFLESIYVSPLSRRMGVARALCTSIEQCGVLQGCEEFAQD